MYVPSSTPLTKTPFLLVAPYTDLPHGGEVGGPVLRPTRADINVENITGSTQPVSMLQDHVKRPHPPDGGRGQL